MTTAFVLSGGGSLGAVQVGMLQALGERGVEPDLLVGTSAGAINAAFVGGHGMGRDALIELAGLWQSLRRRDLFALRPLHGVLAVAGELIARAKKTTGSWLDTGGPDLPMPQRFLSMHDHERPSGIADRPDLDRANGRRTASSPH